MIDTPDQATSCTKHINVSYHWIREEMQKQAILPEYIPSEKNVSDIFTKGLHGPKHKELCKLLGMGPRTELRGSVEIIYIIHTTRIVHILGPNYLPNMDAYLIMFIYFPCVSFLHSSACLPHAEYLYCH
jgi:hypothetical protein